MISTGTDPVKKFPAQFTLCWNLRCLIGLKKITRLETVNKNQENYTENKLLNATSADDIFTLFKCIVDVSQYSSNAHQH